MNALRVVGIVVMLFITSCSSAETASVEAAHHKFVLVGSTPCDAAIKPALGITVENCDFIRWNLTLDQTRGRTFTLNANYGVGQPNTKGFVGGGQRLSTAGTFEISTGKAGREIYRLKSSQPAINVSLEKLNLNLFHVLGADDAMLIGNGGWSFTLNRSPAIATAKPPASSALVIDSPQTIFVGRTPCREISAINGAPGGPDCFKLKWKLTLNRDGSTFKIESTFAREKPVTGKWSRDGGILKLAPDAGIKPVSLLAVDENHLLFLDSGGRPLTGNEDFSYTLNRGSD